MMRLRHTMVTPLVPVPIVFVTTLHLGAPVEHLQHCARCICCWAVEACWEALRLPCLCTPGCGACRRSEDGVCASSSVRAKWVSCADADASHASASHAGAGAAAAAPAGAVPAVHGAPAAEEDDDDDDVEDLVSRA